MHATAQADASDEKDNGCVGPISPLFHLITDSIALLPITRLSSAINLTIGHLSHGSNSLFNMIYPKNFI
jgi:hypothetical protein